MRLIIRVVLLMMLFALTIPAFAQEETDFDPEADFTNTYTFENITLSHPDVLTVSSDSNFQILLYFDDTSKFGDGEVITIRDSITILTPQTLAYAQIPNESIEVVAEFAFDNTVGLFEDAPTFEEALMVVEFAGYDEVYTFMYTHTRESGVRKIFVYTFMVGEEIFVVTFFTEEAVFPADVEIRVLERVLESMVVDGVSGVVEATAEATISTAFETRPAPTEAVELTQEVSLYDGEIGLTIPSEWVSVIEDYIVASSDVAVEAVFGDVALDDGEVALQIISPERMSELGLDEVTILTVTTAVQSQYPDMPIFAYDGLPYEAYFVPVTDIDAPEGSFFFIFQVGDDAADVAVVIGVAPDYDSAEALIIAIINSISYTPAETEE